MSDDAPLTISCKRCGESKPTSSFYPDPRKLNGCRMPCIVCTRSLRKKPKLQKPKSDSKSCRRCGETKPLSAFHANPTLRDGRASYCKLCMKEYAAERYAGNPDIRQNDIERAKQRQREAYSTEEGRLEFRRRQNEWSRSYTVRRRDDEQFEAFMARMEQEALEAESLENTA